jgi:3-hydroxyisobutyrate dehydrogenase
MATIAFLGLGNMGGPMSANLVAAGHTVRGFDPGSAAAVSAADKGVQVFGSEAEAVADAEVVVTMLPNGELVKRRYAEVLTAVAPGTLFIDSSTIAVNDAREVNRLASEHGFAQLDAPVSGGVNGAVAGTLTFMVGGEDSAVEGLAMDAVKSTGSAAPLGSHAAEIYTTFAADHADKDFSAVIEMIRNA